MNYRIMGFKVLKFSTCLENGLITNEVFIFVLFNYLFLSNILPGCYMIHPTTNLPACSNSQV